MPHLSIGTFARAGIGFVTVSAKRQAMVVMGLVIYALYLLATLWLFAGTAIQLHLLWHARRVKMPVLQTELSSFPFVTVQVPVYNEKFVIAGLLHCLSKLDYPKSLFEIQVLDDSTDETSALIDAQAEAMRKQGVNVSVVRRTDRKGYKAGALEYGLRSAKGEFIAVFDADFRPRPDFLKAVLPSFADASTGMAQARWAHQNKDENYLTRIQTYLLDLHFGVEQEGRSTAGYFMNFCGTAGIWRKQCIADAGGWDGAVLSEDLDLSYRAQLKGWKAAYVPNVEVPAQLPAHMDAFKAQQFRWNKGMAQTARKTLGRVLGANTTLPKKAHGVFHLLGSFTFVCLFVSAVLTVPLLHLRLASPLFLRLTNYSLISNVSLLGIVFLYYNSTAPKERQWTGFVKNYSLFALVYLALSVQNTIGVLQGFAGRNSPFVRTPKFAEGSASASAYKLRKDKGLFWLEVATFLYFLYGVCLSLYKGDYFFLGIQVLFCCGLALILYPALPSIQTVLWPGRTVLKTASSAT